MKQIGVASCTGRSLLMRASIPVRAMAAIAASVNRPAVSSMDQPPNIDEIHQFLDAFMRSITFTRRGQESSMGKDVAMTIIRGPDAGGLGGIAGRCADGTTPEGVAWPENSDNPAGDGYKSNKMKKYGWDETNRRTGQMLSQASLYGRTTIEPEVVTLRYGEDKPPGTSVAPTGYASDQDKATTDVTKAVHAHSAGRGFYGIGEGDPENVTAVCQLTVNDMIREAGGG